LVDATHHRTPERFAREPKSRVCRGQGDLERFGDLRSPYALELEQREDRALVQVHRGQGSFEELQIVTAFEQQRSVVASVCEAFQEFGIRYFATQMRATSPISRGVQAD
jgi:hypothetical protein